MADKTFSENLELTLGFNYRTEDLKEIEERIEQLPSFRLFKEKNADEDIKRFKDKLIKSDYAKIISEDLKKGLEYAEGIGDKEIANKFKSQIEDLRESLKREGIGEEYNRKKFKEKVSIKELFDDYKKEIGENLVRNIVTSVKKAVDKVKDYFVEVREDAIDRIGDMATYELGSSLVSNTSAREQALTYGLSNAENYALTETMKELGMSSEEDLLWMNKDQQAKFAERIGYYTGRYSELANRDFFNTFQEFQLEMKEFKSELEMDVIEWIVNNKDLIKTFMTTAMNTLKWILEIISRVFGGAREISSSDRIEAAQQAISNNNTTYITNNNTTNNYNASTKTSGVINNNPSMTYSSIRKGYGY